MTKFTRRNLLQTAGLSLSSLALPSVGRTQGVDDLKLVFVYAEAGWTSRFYDMRPPWAPPEWSSFHFYEYETFLKPDDVEFEFDLTDSRLTEDDFSRLLKPLYRHRDVMLATEGLAMLTTALDPNGDAHALAHLHSWSATPAASADGVKSRGSVPSCDQRILDHIRKTDPGHLSMDFRPFDGDLFHEWLYRDDGAGGAARLSTEFDPAAAYDRFFGSTDTSNPLRVNANMSLAMAMEQFTALAPRLSSEDRLKLEAHRDMLQTLEQKLNKVVSCDGILRPAISGSLSRSEKFVADLDAFQRLIVAGLGCGVSRVATLGPIQPFPEQYGLTDSTDIHHEYEHPTDPHSFFNDEPLPDLYLEKEEAMVRRNEMQMATLANFLDLLRATPDSKGGNLLDTTLVVYMSEISHGNHGHEHYPSLIFGGGDTFSLGRYVKYAQNLPNPWRNYNNEFTGPAHSRLLISVLQSFGIEIENFGVATVPGRAPHAPGDPQADLQLGGKLPRLKV